VAGRGGGGGEREYTAAGSRAKRGCQATITVRVALDD